MQMPRLTGAVIVGARDSSWSVREPELNLKYSRLDYEFEQFRHPTLYQIYVRLEESCTRSIG